MCVFACLSCVLCFIIYLCECDVRVGICVFDCLFDCLCVCLGVNALFWCVNILDIYIYLCVCVCVCVCVFVCVYSCVYVCV